VQSRWLLPYGSAETMMPSRHETGIIRPLAILAVHALLSVTLRRPSLENAYVKQIAGCEAFPRL
jgi:hypothetical protein